MTLKSTYTNYPNTAAGTFTDDAGTLTFANVPSGKFNLYITVNNRGFVVFNQTSDSLITIGLGSGT